MLAYFCTIMQMYIVWFVEIYSKVEHSLMT